jgi:hypothetical protein
MKKITSFPPTSGDIPMNAIEKESNHGEERTMRPGITVFLKFIMVLVLFACGSKSYAAEGASSHYLPGLAGDVLLAVPPQPGLQAANVFFYQSGNVARTVLEGRVSVNLDLDLFLDVPVATYTFEKPVLGGTYTMGVAMPFGNANFKGRITGPLGNFLSRDESSFDLSDIVVTPLQLNWNYGYYSLKLAEAVIAPTGSYDINNLANLGRNYWSFDTVGAVTWFRPETGLEVSVAPGIMFNTKNNKTSYKTGTEFHLDFTVNQFLAQTFAVGIKGYYYDQLTGDSGSGAVLGNFKSQGLALGPGFVWIPQAGGGKLTVLGKWQHDLHTRNRFDSDYFTLTASWKF